MKRILVYALFAILTLQNVSALQKQNETNYIVLINYHNNCVACLQPVASFYDVQRSLGNRVFFYVDQLEPEYWEEFFLSLGLNKVSKEDRILRAQLDSLGLEPVVAHTIAQLQNGKLLSRHTCVEYFSSQHFRVDRPLLDSFQLAGNYSGLKYRSVGFQRIDSHQIILIGRGYAPLLELYDRRTEKRRDLLEELRQPDFIRQMYEVFWGKKTGAFTYLLRNGAVTPEGRLGSRKEFDIENIQVEYPRIYVTYTVNLAFPDSSTRSRTLLVEYDNTFKARNWWMENKEPALGHYHVSVFPSDRFLKEGNRILLPIYDLEGEEADTMYNLAMFTLGDKHQLVFTSLLPFYEPVEKQKILRTKLYNFFSGRTLLRKKDSLYVIYDMMPFVYTTGNRIADTLHVRNDLFVRDPDFRALGDSTRDQNGNFSIPFHQQIIPYGDSLIIIAREFGISSIALYDGQFNLVAKTYLNRSDINGVAAVWKDKALFMKRSPKDPAGYYMYEMPLMQLLNPKGSH